MCTYVRVCACVRTYGMYVRIRTCVCADGAEKGFIRPVRVQKKKVDSESRGERGGKTRGQGVATPVTTPTPSASLSLT